MTGTSETKVLSAHVPLPLAEQIDQLAVWFDRSSGWIMKQALEVGVEKEEESSRLTREAIADVERGQFVDHEAVLAWSASLGLRAPLALPIPLKKLAAKK